MVKRQLHTRLMGSSFELIVVETHQALAWDRLRAGVAEITRLEGLLTEFKEDSQTSLINRLAGVHPVNVDSEVAELIQRCLYLSKISQGAFDISAGVLRSLYNFKEKVPRLPSEANLKAVLEFVGYGSIEVNGASVFLRQPGMRIGFGAIGKGYAADKVRALWKAAGVASGVVNASGDLTAWGVQPDGTPWKVGIADPRDPAQILMWLPVEDAAIATSGNYEQYVEIGGVRYSHNLDPRTGRPVKGIKSVTIGWVGDRGDGHGPRRRTSPAQPIARGSRNCHRWQGPRSDNG
jgi:thiamine biosynthesis lipoprotein